MIVESWQSIAGESPTANTAIAVGDFYYNNKGP